MTKRIKGRLERIERRDPSARQFAKVCGRPIEANGRVKCTSSNCCHDERPLTAKEWVERFTPRKPTETIQ